MVELHVTISEPIILTRYHSVFRFLKVDVPAKFTLRLWCQYG